MRTLTLSLVLTIGATFLLASIEPGTAKKGVIEASEIVLKSPDGKHKITILANNAVAGIWIANLEKKNSIAIYENKDQIAIGIYPKLFSTNMGEAYPLLNCLTVDANGDGYLQLYKNGKLLPK